MGRCTNPIAYSDQVSNYNICCNDNNYCYIVVLGKVSLFYSRAGVKKGNILIITTGRPMISRPKNAKLSTAAVNKSLKQLYKICWILIYTYMPTTCMVSSNLTIDSASTGT